VQCPKCGETVQVDAVICPRCDYILDTSFLGDDILNEHNTGGAHKPVQISSAGDAVVLGGLDEEIALFSESTGSFLTADTVDVDRQLLPALYVGKSVQDLMKPEAVLKQAPDLEQRKAMLSPFELHVLSFVDGRRPVARIRKKSGLSPDDVRIAVGMLAEKGAVLLAGRVAPPDLKNLLGSALEDESASFEGVPVVPVDDFDADATTEDMKVPGDVTAPSKKSGEWKPALPEVDATLAGSRTAGAAASPWEMPQKRPPGVMARQPSALGVDEQTRLVKERAAGFFELAHTELNKGNRVRAHVYAKLAADTDPDEPKYQALLKSWPQAARAAATPEAVLFADADAAEKQGNHHKALALMEQALAANQNAAAIHNRVGLLLATRFKRLSKASEHLLKACELEPNNVVFKNNLGKIIALAHDKGGPVPSSQKDPGLLGKLKKALD
jgi:tetratricopeptide (TPR) repeat protein